MEYIKFDYEKEYIKEFLALPKRLYRSKENMENPKEIRQLLTNVHPLSKYFTLDKFLIIREKEVVARFAITSYPNDSTAYFGFFECINDDTVAKFAFDTAHCFVKGRYKKMVGPVDASFWIKYRLKINSFDKKPYTGEPYNKEYYLQLYQNNGFQIAEHYVSNQYQMVSAEYRNQKCMRRYEDFSKKGYVIKNANIEEFDSTLEDLYYLLTKLYRDFPIYKELSLEDFIDTFRSYKSIINVSMVKLAYFEDKLVGFFISVPNYTNLVYHLTPFNLMKIIHIKNTPREYVMLYMGVDESHIGLGSALSHSIVNELKNNGASSIGALARDGKVTQNYVGDLITEKYEYVLLEKKL